MAACREIVSAENSIASAQLATQEFQRRIDDGNAIIERVDVLRREQLRAWSDLSRVSNERRLAISTAAFLRELETLAGRLQLKVVSITPAHESLAPRTPQAKLLPTPMSILVRGDFRSVVRFLQEVTEQRSLVGLDSAQLAASSVSSTRGKKQLDVSIRLTLYRLLLDAADASAD